MIEWLWFIVYGIFIVTASPQHLTFSKDGDDHRSFNLALETILEFNREENAKDIKFLDNVHNFIDKVKTVINKNNILRRDFSNGTIVKFTDFIQKLIKILCKYEDKDIKHFVTIISQELRKYHYKGCKFHELIDNYNLRKYIAGKLEEYKNIPGAVIKERLIAIVNKIKEKKYAKNEKDLIDYINSLYRKDSIVIFSNILLNLDDYRLKTRSNMNLETVIRNGVRSVLFDYYTNLNFNARAALKSKLDDYTKQVMEIKTLLRPLLTKHVHEFKDTTRNSDQTYSATLIGMYDDKIATSSIQNMIYPRNALRNRQTTDYEENFNRITHLKPKKHKKKKATTEARVKKMTFMTLYPAFVANWNMPDPVIQNVDSHKKKTIRKAKRTTKKAEEISTFRQMYVEKNLDLKYDPYAYDHLTTETKLRKRKTTESDTYNALTQQTKLKLFKLVTMRPLNKVIKHERVSSNPSVQSHENADQTKYHKIHLKQPKSHSKKTNKNLRQPIVPMKKPKQNLGYPIGLLMNDEPAINHQLEASINKHHKAKPHKTLSSTTTHQYTYSKEDDTIFEEKITEEEHTKASSLITTRTYRKQPRTVSTTTIKHKTSSREDISNFDDYLTDGEPKTTTKAVHINNISTVSPDKINKNTRSINHQLEASSNKHHKAKLDKTVSSTTTNQYTYSMQDDAIFEENITETEPTEASSVITPRTYRKQPRTVSTTTEKHKTSPREHISNFEDYFTDEEPKTTTTAVHINKISSVSPDTINKDTRSSREEAAIFEDDLTQYVVEDFRDASIDQLKVLAADIVNNYTGFDDEGEFPKVNYRGNNRRSNSDHEPLDQNILNRLHKLENELKVVKTQIKDDIETIKDLKSIVNQKELESMEFKHTREGNKDISDNGQQSKHDFVGHIYKENNKINQYPITNKADIIKKYYSETQLSKNDIRHYDEKSDKSDEYKDFDRPKDFKYDKMSFDSHNLKSNKGKKHNNYFKRHRINDYSNVALNVNTENIHNIHKSLTQQTHKIRDNNYHDSKNKMKDEQTYMRIEEKKPINTYTKYKLPYGSNTFKLSYDTKNEVRHNENKANRLMLKKTTQNVKVTYAKYNDKSSHSRNVFGDKYSTRRGANYDVQTQTRGTNTKNNLRKDNERNNKLKFDLKQDATKRNTAVYMRSYNSGRVSSTTTFKRNLASTSNNKNQNRKYDLDDSKLKHSNDTQEYWTANKVNNTNTNKLDIEAKQRQNSDKFTNNTEKISGLNKNQHDLKENRSKSDDNLQHIGDQLKIHSTSKNIRKVFEITPVINTIAENNLKYTIGDNSNNGLKDDTLKPTASDVVEKHNKGNTESGLTVSNRDQTYNNTNNNSIGTTPVYDDAAAEYAIQKEEERNDIEKILLNDDWEKINPSKMFSEMDQITLPSSVERTVRPEIILNDNEKTTTKTVSTTAARRSVTYFREIPPHIDEVKIDGGPMYINTWNVLKPAEFVLNPQARRSADLMNVEDRPLSPMVGEQNLVAYNPDALDKDIRERYRDKIKSYTMTYMDDPKTFLQDQKNQELGQRADSIEFGIRNSNETKTGDKDAVDTFKKEIDEYREYL